MTGRRGRERRVCASRWFRAGIVTGLVALGARAGVAEQSEPTPKTSGRSDIRDLLTLSSKAWGAFGSDSGSPGRSWVEGFDAFHGRTGLTPQIGGVVSGSGLGLGVTQVLLEDRNSILGWQALSTYKGYREVRLFQGESLDAAGRVRLHSELRYRDLAAERFHGTGMDSLGSDRSIFRSREFLARSELRLAASRSLTVAIRGELQNVRSDDGRGATFAFQDATGHGQSLSHAGVGASLSWDTRDKLYAREGSFVRAGVMHFYALSETPSFEEIDFDAQHAIRLPRYDHALVGRVGIVFRVHEPGTELPFYLTRSLGGSRSLRGYARHRFRGDDVAIMTVEYRAAVVSKRLDAVAFWDAGGAYDRLGELTLASLRHSIGGGLRVLSKGRVLARIELAHGGEGTRLVLSFSAPF
jgi:hypothetical protein